jgi:hypothetical protein
MNSLIIVFYQICNSHITLCLISYLSDFIRITAKQNCFTYLSFKFINHLFLTQSSLNILIFIE